MTNPYTTFDNSSHMRQSRFSEEQFIAISVEDNDK